MFIHRLNNPIRSPVVLTGLTRRLLNLRENINWFVRDGFNVRQFLVLCVVYITFRTFDVDKI